jgi:hypothetical protein
MYIRYFEKSYAIKNIQDKYIKLRKSLYNYMLCVMY